MADIKTRTSVADELRAAAETLRAHPERPADEPLAAWLEQVVVWYGQTTVVLNDREHVLHHACGGVHGEDCECFAHPLAVARALNGSGS